MGVAKHTELVRGYDYATGGHHDVLFIDPTRWLWPYDDGLGHKQSYEKFKEDKWSILYQHKWTDTIWDIHVELI